MSTSEGLERLAGARFALLNKGEMKMLHAAAKGTIAFCGPSQNDDDPENDPANSANWSADRHIRSDLLSWLCIDEAASDYVDPKGIQLHGALISGPLDLSFVTVDFPLRLYRCRLSDDWNLNYIQIHSLQFTGTWVRSLSADVARVRGSVFLKAGLIDGKIQLRGAHIGLNLDCSGGRLWNPGNEKIPDSGMALNAEGAKVDGSVFLRENFSAEGEVRLLNTEIGGNLDCSGSRFQNSANARIPNSGFALNAEGARIGGHVFLNNNFLPEGEVRLFNAEIGGNLECSASKFQNPAQANIPGSGVALNAEGTKIGGHVFLRTNLSEGEVRLFNAEIGGNLECDGSNFQNPAQADIPGAGMALNAEGAKIEGSVFLRQNFSADGAVRLFGAEIGQVLDCGAGKFQNPADAAFPGTGIALNAEGAKVGGHVFLNNNCFPLGEVKLFNAKIGGNLDCAGSKFQNPANAKIPSSGMALNGEGVKVTGSVFTRYDFSAEGEVVLFNAEIGGDLDCGRGSFQNPGNAATPRSGVALNAIGAKVGGSVFLRWGFSADGAVQLFGAEIGRSIDCDGGKIQNPANAAIPGSGVALNAEIVKVGGPVTLNNFLPQGEVRLFNAKIVGDLDCSGGKFNNPANESVPGSGVALDATGLNIHGSLLLGQQFSAAGSVKLVNARITGSLRCSGAAFETLELMDVSAGSLMDDKASWPTAGKLLLDGFVYGRISGIPIETRERLEWLKLQPSFARQPYRQLASILGNAGDDLGSRRVLSEMQRQAWEQRRQPVRLISHLLRLTIGYGYFPLRAVWLIVLLVGIGSGVYWMAYKTGSIVPTQKDAYASFAKNCYAPIEYERFHAIPYSLENSFPLVKLGIHDKWAPAPETPVPACWSKDLNYPQAFSSPGFLSVFRWIQVCFGWILTTLFVGGVTGILRKN